MDIDSGDTVVKIVHAVRTQLSWAHYRELIVIEDSKEREFYENKTIINSWSSRELQKHIKVKLYGNTPKKEIQAVFQTLSTWCYTTAAFPASSWWT